MRATAEWQLRHSLQQRYLDRAALLAFLILLLWILPFPLYLSLLFGAPLVYLLDHLAAKSQNAVMRIGYSLDGLIPQWWVEKEGEQQRVQWRNGSVRRTDLIILQWSFWPWNRVILRADSFDDKEQFRQLKIALYRSL